MNELNERVDNLENFVKAGFGRLNREIANLQVAAKNQEGRPANPGKNAPNQIQDDLTYKYVSREKVNALVVLCEKDLEKFVLLLEEEVYKNDYRGMYQLVGSRLFSQERVYFIRECVFKHYEVPEHLRNFVWKTLEECLNKRVREKQKKA